MKTGTYWGLCWAITFAALLLVSCDKMGPMAGLQQLAGNWVEVKLPPGCVAKQITASSHTTAVLCEDGRVFH